MYFLSDYLIGIMYSITYNIFVFNLFVDRV